VALFAVLAVFFLSSALLYAKDSASSLYKRGVAAEAREDFDTAFTDYQKACAKEPKNMYYRAAFYRVRVSASGLHMTKGRKLLEAGDEQGALTEFLHASEIDPANEAPEQEIAKIRRKQGEAPVSETSLPEEPGKQAEIDSIGEPVELRPLTNEPLTLHMTEDAKTIYLAIGKAAGVNILFDPDYTSKRTQVDLNNVSLTDALRIVGTMTNTFWRPVTENTLFVAANTRAKRTELDEQAVETFYLTNAWQQNDLNDVQTALRNVLPGAKVYGVASQNAIVMRGTPDELLLAQKLVNDLDKARAEVVVDVAVLQVSKNWERTIGIQWPTSVGIALQPPNSSGSSTTSTTTSTTGTTGSTDTGTSPSLYDLAHLKATDFAVTVGSATANLLLTDSNTKILDNPRIRSTDAQKATFTVGEKIPVATGSYQTGAATAVVSSLVNTQFQYQDVGVKVEMTPTIHFDHDITLKIKIEVSSVASEQNISGVTEPIIAQNIVDQVIRLREGEASILGGIQENQETVSWSGIPGLSSIPLLRYLFGSKDHTINDTELVFLLVPHIVRTQSLDLANLRTVDTGQGTSVDLRHVAPRGPASNSDSISAPVVSPVRFPSNAQSNFGTVPSQSAQAAAPAMLAQLKQAANANGQTSVSDAVAHQPMPPLNSPPAPGPATPVITINRPPPPNPQGPIPTAPAPNRPPAPTPQSSAAPTTVVPNQPAQPIPQNQVAVAGAPSLPAAAPAKPSPAGPVTFTPVPPPPGANGPSSPPNLPGPPRPGDMNPGNVNLMLNVPPGPITARSSFKVSVVLAGGKDIISAPMQVQYDPAKLSLVNVGAGDFLNRDGNAVALVHRDDPPGSIVINASRPQGAAGVSGAGVVCVLTFQAKVAGESALAIANPMPKNSSQHVVPASGSRVSIVVK
jgi:general secretion pathway protein D